MGFFFYFYIITRFSRYYGIYNFFALFVSLFKIPLKQFNTDSYLWRLSLTRDLSLDGLIPHACHHGPNAIFFLNWFFFLLPVLSVILSCWPIICTRSLIITSTLHVLPFRTIHPFTFTCIRNTEFPPLNNWNYIDKPDI